MLAIYLFFLSCLFSLSCAERVIRANALLTCMANSQFSASKFDVVFHPDNQTASFNIDAITTLEGYYAAKVSVIAYGIEVVTENVDFCKLGSSASKQLCPLSPGRLQGLKGTQQLSKDVVGNIPNIAFSIPDLDGIVRVTVYPRNSTKNADPVACVEATLTNDKTVQTKGVSWAFAIFFLVGFLFAGGAWLSGNLSVSTHIAAYLVSLFMYLQSVAMIAMMGVEHCPPIAAAWAQNFMWIMGIVSVPFMQKIINWYIQSTGGVVSSILVNKKYMSISLEKRGLPSVSSIVPLNYLTLPSSSNGSPLSSLSKLVRRSAASQFVDNGTTDELLDNYSAKVLILRGIRRAAFLANIEITSLFMTAIVIFIVLIFLILILLLILYLFVQLLAWFKLVNHRRLMEIQKNAFAIIKGILLRFFFMTFPFVCVFCFWEFTQHESLATVFLAVLILISSTGTLAVAGFNCISVSRLSLRRYNNPALIPYSDSQSLNRWGYIYTFFKASSHSFILPLLSYFALKGLIIALSLAKAKVPSLALLVLELALLVYIILTKPYMDPTTNTINIVVSVINSLNALVFLFFSNLIPLPRYVSGIFGVLFFVTNAIFSLVLLIIILVACGYACFAKNPEARYTKKMGDHRVLYLTDGFDKAHGSFELQDRQELEKFEKLAKIERENSKRNDSKKKAWRKKGIWGKRRKEGKELDAIVASMRNGSVGSSTVGLGSADNGSEFDGSTLDDSYKFRYENYHDTCTSTTELVNSYPQHSQQSLQAQYPNRSQHPEYSPSVTPSRTPLASHIDLNTVLHKGLPAAPQTGPAQYDLKGLPAALQNGAPQYDLNTVLHKGLPAAPQNGASQVRSQQMYAQPNPFSTSSVTLSGAANEGPSEEGNKS